MAEAKVMKLEPLECPICLELPINLGFQCRNGHVICQVCSSSAKVELCPQCRVPYDKEGVRNRALEKPIGGMTVSCTHERHGCKQTISRNEFLSHVSSCKFRPMGICKFVGYPSCNFVSAKAGDIFAHLSATHGKRVTKTNSTRSSLQIIVNSVKSRRDIDFGFLVETSAFRLFQVIRVNNARKEVTFNSTHFSETEDDCPYKLNVKFVAPEKEICFSWRVTPVWYKNIERSVERPSLKIPFGHFLECMNEVGSKLEVVIWKK